MEKISIIIPSYNGEHFVKKCLESVMQQTYSNLEIICVDDGSSDKTFEILKKMQSLDNRIHLISQKNSGLSGARNAGLRIASGSYVMFVDSDDWLEYNSLEKIFDPGYDLICFSYNRIFRNRTEPRKLNLSGVFSSMEIQRRIVGISGSELLDPSQANSLVTAWAKIYRARILKDNHLEFVDTKMIGTEDAFFNIQYLNCCSGKVKVVDEPLYNYVRYNISSLTSTYKPNLISQWKLLHEQIFNIIKNKPHYFHEAFYNRIALSIVGLGLNEMEQKGNTFSKLQNISHILNDPLYVESFNRLNYQYFPIHWKVLFLMAKFRLTWGVFIMMKLMSILWKRKNK